MASLGLLTGIPKILNLYIIPVKDNELLATDINNIVCLCKACHKLAHKNGCRQPVVVEIQNKLFQYISEVVSGL